MNRPPAAISDELDRASQDSSSTLLPAALINRRAALVIAHPGHELRVYQWLKLAQPVVFVVTDGSGRTGQSRLHRTTAIVESVGARAGKLYGELTDTELYSTITSRNTDCFTQLAASLANGLDQEQIDYVVGDAVEGYNPAHDLCRYLTNAAIGSLHNSGRGVDNYDVGIARAHGNGGGPDSDTLSIKVESATLEEKMRIALGYPELVGDVQNILSSQGIDSLRTERLRRVTGNCFDSPESPYYERYGREQVALGHYREVITYRQHLKPIAEALRGFSEARSARVCEFS